MTTEQKNALLKNRKNVLINRGRDNSNIIRKIDRQLRNSVK